MEDLTRKGDDVDRVVDLSQNLQDVLNVSIVVRTVFVL